LLQCSLDFIQHILVTFFHFFSMNTRDMSWITRRGHSLNEHLVTIPLPWGH
jgi:hypothetical protein